MQKFYLLKKMKPVLIEEIESKVILRIKPEYVK